MFKACWDITKEAKITSTAQKMKFSIKDFFSKCEQIRKKLQICSHLLKKSLMENFIFLQCNIRCCADDYAMKLTDFFLFFILILQQFSIKGVTEKFFSKTMANLPENIYGCVTA